MEKVGKFEERQQDGGKAKEGKGRHDIDTPRHQKKRRHGRKAMKTDELQQQPSLHAHSYSLLSFDQTTPMFCPHTNRADVHTAATTSSLS
jgi:hypothetical protein